MERCNDLSGRVHSLETFGLVDGPGVRFVVFLQGCMMRCRYCHNPETWERGGGTLWRPADLFRHVYRYEKYWKKNGGITVSGGEPLLQLPFVSEFFRLAKEKNVHTALDTCGQPFSHDPEWLSSFDGLLENTDLVLLDLKEMGEEAHKSLTGHGNSNILEMARYLSEHGIPMWIRHVLVPGLTDDPDGLREMDAFIRSLSNVKKVEVLPYHSLGTFKWERLGIPCTLKDAVPPTKEEVETAEALLHAADYA